MIRLLAAAPIALSVFVAVLALAALAVHTGFVPEDAINLWAGSIAAGDGEVPLGRILAAYPSIPFLATTLLQVVTPAGTPTPALLAAALLGLLAGMWFLAFRHAGLNALAAIVVTLLIAFHPALVRAAVAGPAEMFFALFLFLLAKGLYDLRANSAAPEVMTVALALLALAFSHPMGAAIAVAVVPFLVFAVRPVLIANSALNMVVALVFPTVFAVGAFTYVSWVFPGNGWTFLSLPSAGLAAWTAGVSGMVGGGLTGSRALDAGIAVAVALGLGAPLVPMAVGWVRRRRPLLAPAVVLVATIIAAAMITVATGLFGEPAVLVVAAPILAAAVMLRVPPARERLISAVALLAIGWVGGIAGLVAVDPRVVANLRDAVNVAGGDRDRIDALNLGRASAGREGVLVDTFSAPAVVLGRGEARGLAGPQSETFTLAMLFMRINTPLVAVPDPNSAAGAQDRLNKAFPQLYRFGASGYRLIYQNATWRLFERTESGRVYRAE